MYRHHVKLPEHEVAILRRAVGRRVASVVTDDFAVEVALGSTLLRFDPEEVATPDAEHPYGDVERLTVTQPEEPMSHSHARRVVGQFGEVTSVDLLSTNCGFTPVVRGAAYQLLGVEIPEGNEYGLEFADSASVRRLESRDWIEFDAAVVLWTTAGHIAAFTNGIGYFVGVATNTTIPADWAYDGLVKVTNVVSNRQSSAFHASKILATGLPGLTGSSLSA